MGERTNFEKLRAYQLSEQLSDRVWAIVRRWDNLSRDTVGKQLIRAADSVGANLAEGSGRESIREKRYHSRVARGSLYETKHWLRRAYTRSLLTPKQTDSLQVTVAELTKTLNGYLTSLNRRNPKPKH